MSESFWDAKPARRQKASESPSVHSEGVSDDISLVEVQRLLFDVQSRQEEAVLKHASLIDDYIDAEEAWKSHQSRILLGIRDRIARQDPNDKNREKSSQDLREAEVMAARDETGENKGSELYRAYRLMEERVRSADRYCKTLADRGRFLQSLAANLREIS
jgi:hypothetical protein